MHVVLLGPPGSGKSTQAARVAERLGVPHISMGALLRARARQPGPIGERIRDAVERGDLVDDETAVGVLVERLRQTREGWVLDGFPRTASQAAALDACADQVGSIEAVIYLDVSEEILLDRLRARATTIGRTDDTEDTMRRRLRVFADNREPLLAYYEDRKLLKRVDAGRGPDEVTRAILAALGAQRVERQGRPWTPPAG